MSRYESLWAVARGDGECGERERALIGELLYALASQQSRNAHLERQVQELQEANNREVERRRKSERALDAAWEATGVASTVRGLTTLADVVGTRLGRLHVVGFSTDDPNGRALYDVAVELRRVLSIHTRPYASLHEGAAILREEHDELWDEVKKREQHRPSVRAEASQVAAVALRIMAELTEEQT